MVVAGTGTEVGKTWAAVRLITELRSDGRSVAARKPAQSFDPPPHATLARLDVPPARTLEGVRTRLAGLLPAAFVASELTVMEESERDVWRVRKHLPLGTERP